MTELKKVPISERALVGRLKRKLAKDGVFIRKCRQDSQWYGDLGDYYLVDAHNHIAGTHIELEGYAREQGSLSEYEVLADA